MSLSYRVSAEITIYNSWLGLVKDRRNVPLSRGDSVLQLMDVASLVIPSSVSVEAVSEKGAVSVLEQNYEYDLHSPAKLLEKYVGRTVRVRYRNPYTDREDEKTAKVLAYNDGQPVLQIDNEVTFGIPGNYIFPQVPEDLIARPTLSWLLRTDSAGARQLETLYLTEGMTWRADYVLVLQADEKTAGVSAWVTLENRIDHTPIDEKIRMTIGNAFDVVGDRKQTSWSSIATNVTESAYEISLRNHKKEDITVRVEETIPGEWKILESSHPHKKEDSGTAAFSVKVPRDGEVVVRYKVRSRF